MASLISLNSLAGLHCQLVAYFSLSHQHFKVDVVGTHTLPFELDHQLKSSATIKEILAAASIMNLPAHAAGEEEQVDNSEDSCNRCHLS